MRTITIFYDEESGEMFFEGVSSRMNSRNDDPLIQREYEKIVGPASKMIIYNAIKKSNSVFFNYIHRSILKKGKLSKKEGVVRLLGLLPRMGYGVVELADWDEDKGMFKVNVRNCYNAIVYEDSRKPVCYEMSGKLAALFEVVFGRKADCSERICLAMPEYDHCEFEIKLSDEGIGEIGMPYNIQKDSKEYKEFELLFDEDKGEIIFEKNSSAIIPREEQPAIKREFENIIGITADTIAHDVAKYATIEAVSSIQKVIIKPVGALSKRRIIFELLKQLPRRGYGIPELTSYDEENLLFRVRVKNSFDVVGYRYSDKPVCSVMSGVFAGDTEEVFKREMECIETKCMAMGDPYCEFEVFEKKRMEKLYDILRDLMSIGDIDGSLIMARDGTLLASYLPENINAERVAMMASTVAGSARRVNDELDRESVNRITVETDEAKLIITRTGENADLIVITKSDIYLGLIFAGMMDITKRIEREI